MMSSSRLKFNENPLLQASANGARHTNPRLIEIKCSAWKLTRPSSSTAPAHAVPRHSGRAAVVSANLSRERRAGTLLPEPAARCTTPMIAEHRVQFVLLHPMLVWADSRIDRR